MGLKVYKASRAVLTAAKSILGVRLRGSGFEHLSDRPTLFVVNHFTRFETFLVPYVISTHTGRQVRSLATHTLFRGWFGRYLRALGVMSTHHPRRNRTIIGELMTGRHDWVIYPEGGLIKNKKMVEKGRLRLNHPARQGPPHTGAALLALKAEICKRRYLAACEADDTRRIRYYQRRYGLMGPVDLSPHGTVIVPVNITFYPMRPGRNFLSRLAHLLSRNLDPRVDEELQFEGRILLNGADISIHFGEPIEVAGYQDKATELARRFVGMFSELRRTNLFLRRQAARLTEDFMRAIYNNTEINLDHLFCYGLRALRRDRVAMDELHSALHLAALELAKRDDLRLHPSLGNGLTALAAGERYEPLENVVGLARKAGILRIEDGCYVINRASLDQYHDFHKIRLRNMVQVIANELEPIKPAVDVLKNLVNLSTEPLKLRASRAITEHDRGTFLHDYQAWFDPDNSKPAEMGEPFFLESSDREIGVVLAHGYLAAPHEVRPLAEYLHERGYSVYGVRLKGHGTAPRELSEVGWESWAESMLHGYSVVRNHCRKVVVGGFSLGGVLALLLAARHGAAVNAVFSINAPMKVRDVRAPLVPAVVRFNGAMRRLRLANSHFWRSNNKSESPDINYPVDYLAGVHELRRAVDACRKSLGDVVTPALIIQADDDPLIVASSGRTIVANLGSEIKILSELRSDRHMVIRGDGSERVFEEIYAFIEQEVKERAR